MSTKYEFYDSHYCDQSSNKHFDHFFRLTLCETDILELFNNENGTVTMTEVEGSNCDIC
jgi:hypothetical protein